MGVLYELVQGLLSTRPVLGHQADVGSPIALWDHPEIALLGVAGPDVEVQVPIGGDIRQLVLHPRNDLALGVQGGIALELDQLGADRRDARCVDYDLCMDWELVTLAVAKPSSE